MCYRFGGNKLKRGGHCTSNKTLFEVFQHKLPIIIIQWISVDGNSISSKFLVTVVISCRDLSNNKLENLPPHIFRNITAVDFLWVRFLLTLKIVLKILECGKYNSFLDYDNSNYNVLSEGNHEFPLKYYIQYYCIEGSNYPISL